MKKKTRKAIRKFLNSSGLSAIIGVIIGGLITAYISFESQNLTIENQQKEFKNQYLIQKNSQLSILLEDFIDNLLAFGMTKMEESTTRDSILVNMNSASLKIMLLKNDKIGSKCLEVTEIMDSLRRTGTGSISEIHTKAIGDWSYTVQNEMKKIEYEIDDYLITKEVLELFKDVKNGENDNYKIVE